MLEPSMRQLITAARCSEEDLRQMDYPFTAVNPEISVLDILRKMAAKGLLEVQKGAGSAPNKYRPKQKAESDGRVNFLDLKFYQPGPEPRLMSASDGVSATTGAHLGTAIGPGSVVSI
jgi:hypothetical protein